VSGDVVIMGSAVYDSFQKYELHYKLEPSDRDAYIYFAGATTPVVSGQLGIWQTGGLPAGTYSLRLRVLKVNGDYAEYITDDIRVNQGAGAAQEASLTPTPTPASMDALTATPLATVVPTARANENDTPTPTPEPRS
jgi:hypothetical protein